MANRFNQPISIITKGAHVERDLDLIDAVAERGLICVFASLTSLNPAIKRSP